MRHTQLRRMHQVVMPVLGALALAGVSGAQTPSERCMAAQQRARTAEEPVAPVAKSTLRYTAATDSLVWLEPVGATALATFADSTAIVQVAGSEDRPSPWSGWPLVFVSLRAVADISFDLERNDGSLFASYDFASVPIGVYRLAAREPEPGNVVEVRAQLRVGGEKIGAPRRLLWRLQ